MALERFPSDHVLRTGADAPKSSFMVMWTRPWRFLGRPEAGLVRCECGEFHGKVKGRESRLLGRQVVVALSCDVAID